MKVLAGKTPERKDAHDKGQSLEQLKQGVANALNRFLSGNKVMRNIFLIIDTLADEGTDKVKLDMGSRQKAFLTRSCLLVSSFPGRNSPRYRVMLPQGSINGELCLSIDGKLVDEQLLTQLMIDGYEEGIYDVALALAKVETCQELIYKELLKRI